MYNGAMTSTIDRQLLNNIVRLKYRENPMFLEVSSITESRSLGFDGGLKSSEWFPHGTSASAKIVPTFLVKDYQAPTISYRPLAGKEFIKHMLAPIPLNVLLSMASSGWKLQRVFNTCVEKINGLENAPNASGPTPWNKPNYEAFYSMTGLLKRLEEAGCITIGLDPANDSHLLMRIKDGAMKTSAVAELKKMLGLDQNNSDFRLETNFLRASTEDIVVRTRSLMGILFYLSHAVEVPVEDVEHGIVQTTFDGEGAVFDWSQNASGTLLRVHCSKDEPKNAFVATRYRGNWFYINDDDLHSKSTFMFVATLFNLQVGEGSPADIAPMLTIPVAK
jgi:hypothetical protein